MKKLTEFRTVVLVSFLILLSSVLFSQITDQKTYYQGDAVITQVNGYDYITYPEGMHNGNVGAPALPSFFYQYLIPIDQSIGEVIVSPSDPVNMSIQSEIYPMQFPIYLDGSESPPFAEPDPDIYVSNNPYPGSSGIVEVINEEYYMGFHVITVKVCPYEYLPQSQLLYQYQTVSFTLNFVTKDDVPERPIRQTKASLDLSMKCLATLVENEEMLEDWGNGVTNVQDNGSSEMSFFDGFVPTAEGKIPEYIIITSDDIDQYFHDFIYWKQKKGYPTKLVKIEDITSRYTGFDKAEKIRNYLKDVYKYYGYGIYVLLGGDESIIPPRFLSWNAPNNVLKSYPTDHYYATVHGSWNADKDQYFEESELSAEERSEVFFVGRASVKTPDETENFVNKVLLYERLVDIDPNVNVNYVNNIMEATGYLVDRYDHNNNERWAEQHSGPYLITELNNTVFPDNINDYLLFDNPQCILNPSDFGFDYFGYYNNYDCISASSGNDLTSSNFLDIINNGSSDGYYHIIHHEDHSGLGNIGTSAILRGQGITSSDISDLNNQEHLQIVYSQGCNPARFSEDDCFGEAYVNNENGAIAFIGSSEVFEAGHGSYFKRFCEMIYGNESSGNINVSNKLGVATRFSAHNPTNQNQRRIQLLGDPELPIWLKNPPTNQNQRLAILGVPAEIEIGEQLIELTIDHLSNGEEGRVCIYKIGEVLAYKDFKTVGSSVTEKFTINTSSTGEIHITVTSGEHLPQVENRTIVSTTDPHLYIDSYSGSYHLIANDNQNWSSTVVNAGQSVATNVVSKINYYQHRNSFESNIIESGWKVKDDNPGSNPIQFSSVYNCEEFPSSGSAAKGFKFIKATTMDGFDQTNTLFSPYVLINNNKLLFSLYEEPVNNLRYERLEIVVLDEDENEVFITSFSPYNSDVVQEKGWKDKEISFPVSLNSLEETYKIGFKARSLVENPVKLTT